ncbi:hypothetical protein [Curtobacterium sp. BRD11]|uniref:hypothetical protein n=1 Tax=Curtobacterium sp. BRD11 TaxID=2962581 RepID=UPI0028815E6E|nr:hypothetical protein [Curtobacterium sp. BRD11]MDT0211234.1 hypothetical protein [Curtobacterium sp. BRD11]
MILATPEATRTYYRTQQQIAGKTASAADRLLRRRLTDDFDSSWSRLRPDLLALVSTGRAAAAASAIDYIPAVLDETGQRGDPTGVIDTAGFLATAPDGRDLGTLLDEATIRAKQAVGRGLAATEALTAARRWTTGTVLTVMADTSRGVVAADIAQRPTITGYVRMLNPPSCDRCVILAGKWFRWNEGFQRHPRCDCRHIPASEDVAGDYRTDPYEYFHSLSTEDQYRIFGKSNARAITEGADIYRVVNINTRGLGTVKSARKYGTPHRMTPDDIFKVAGTRTNAIRLLEREGYITGPQVRGGNILGQREGLGQFGKGGKARGASDAVRAARETGVRDPLNRYTMTAAERRLYDAKIRMDIANTGVFPRSIGANSADKYVRPQPITDRQLQTIRQQYDDEVRKLRANPERTPESVRTLARLLGINI